MKIRLLVVIGHITALFVFVITQGCVATDPLQERSRSAGAKHKLPFKHEYKGKSSGIPFLPVDPYIHDDNVVSVNEQPMIEEIPLQPYIEEANPPLETDQTTEIYIVKRGDILSQLALDFGTTTTTLVKLNNLSNPDVLYTGQELRVPARRGISKKASKLSGSLKKSESYTIRKGDTLSEIASAAGVPIDELRELNDIEGDLIFAGKTLNIPNHRNISSTTSRSSTSPVLSEKKFEDSGESSRSYTIRKGDTLSKIALDTGISIDKLRALNDIKDHQIFAGKTLEIPNHRGDIVEKKPDPAPEPEPLMPILDEPADTTPSVDIVIEEVLLPGEELEDVARRYGISTAEIIRINRINDPSHVQEGMRLRIPIKE